MTVAASWISKQPNRCGGDACVRDTRITVWGLVINRRLGIKFSMLRRQPYLVDQLRVRIAENPVRRQRGQIESLEIIQRRILRK